MVPKGKGHSGKLDDQTFSECKGYETDRDIVRKNRERRRKRTKKASVVLAQPDWSEMPYIDYLNSVDAILETRLGRTSTQQEMELIDESQEAGCSPEECARDIEGASTLFVARGKEPRMGSSDATSSRKLVAATTSGNGREVKIEQVKDTWMVLFEDRRKGQRYTAAQFYAPDHSREEVVKWAVDHGCKVIN